MGIISNFTGKLYFWYKWMDSLGNFGEILTNSIKIFQFLSFLGNFDNCDDYDNLRYLETPKKSASAQIFLHSSPFIQNNPTIKQAVKTWQSEAGKSNFQMKVNFENVGGWEEGGEWTKWLTVEITTKPQHFLWLINLQPSQQKVQRSMGGFAWKQATSKPLVSLFSAPVGHRPLEFTLDLLVQLVHLVQLVQLQLLLDHLLRPVQHDLLLLQAPAAPATAHSWTLSGQTTFFIPTNKQSTIIFTLSQK